MLAKRIIPCLDIKNGQTVKGIQFEQLRFAGDPVVLAELYAKQGADELVLLDITATVEARNTFADLILRTAKVLDIPFTVGGGIDSIAAVEALLRAGADKVSINSAALKRPELIDELAQAFGNQCIVVAIDANIGSDGDWYAYLNGGRIATDRKVINWAIEAAERGAGEILLTSMAQDGTKDGFALELTRAVSEAITIPLIASGGAGTMHHFADVFVQGGADAALAASVFHFGEISIPALKQYLTEQGIPVRQDQ